MNINLHEARGLHCIPYHDHQTPDEVRRVASGIILDTARFLKLVQKTVGLPAEDGTM